LLLVHQNPRSPLNEGGGGVETMDYNNVNSLLC